MNKFMTTFGIVPAPSSRGLASSAHHRDGNPGPAPLFNSMHSSPFDEKDLDHDAEEFIVSYSQEFPSDAPLTGQGQRLQNLFASY
jgi:hypothetical protein